MTVSRPLLPPHRMYVGGGAGVLLRKPSSLVEVFNNLDEEVINFFKVLREQPEVLARAVECLWLNPAAQRRGRQPSLFETPIQGATV